MILFQGDVQQNPSMLSCSTGNRLALVLDSFVHIFPQDFGSSIEDTEVISIDVGINIDAINLSECGNFVLLALSNGSCQLVNIPTKTPLPPLRISKPNDIPELDGDTKTNVRKYYEPLHNSTLSDSNFRSKSTLIIKKLTRILYIENMTKNVSVHILV